MASRSAKLTELWLEPSLQSTVRTLHLLGISSENNQCGTKAESLICQMKCWESEHYKDVSPEPSSITFRVIQKVSLGSDRGLGHSLDWRGAEECKSENHFTCLCLINMNNYIVYAVNNDRLRGGRTLFPLRYRDSHRKDQFGCNAAKYS